MGVKINILHVFVNEEYKFGNPVGIIIDEKQEVNSVERQRISTSLGFSESVFINNIEKGEVRIFNPKKEVNFAGHALVGTAYFINIILGKYIKILYCRAGQIQTWQEYNLTWIRADLKNTPPWKHEELKDFKEVENITNDEAKVKQHTVVWAWIDKEKGIIRARTFAPDWGIPEDEANGSGSMQLASITGKNLEIHHGKGSVIYARPYQKGFADVGGKVKFVKEVNL